VRMSIIGPGIMPIPPTGWGAVESLVWDYYEELTKQGHEVQIVNTQDMSDIVRTVNGFNPDFVHLQYDDYYNVLSQIDCRKAATAHFAYLEQPDRYGGYWNIMRGFVAGDFDIFCLSEGIRKTYLSMGVEESRLFITPNGARECFSFTESPKFNDRAIYLAKITDRKRQYRYQDIVNLYFAGNLEDSRFDESSERYLGEWSKSLLYESLTDYSSLVLLSDGEADPLVTKEAMMAGLGLVISQCSTANLDLSKGFIDVVPNERLNDVDYISKMISENIEKSIGMRKEIRDYAVENFSWSKVVGRFPVSSAKE